jgi:hypothetical protein
MRVILVFFCTLFLFSAPVFAEQSLTASGASDADSIQSGKGFYNQCSNEDPLNTKQLFTCLSYVRGLRDGFDIFVTSLKASPIQIGPNPYIFCEPVNTTIDQEMDVLLKFIKKHPECKAIKTSIVFLRALAVAFPCHSD